MVVVEVFLFLRLLRLVRYFAMGNELALEFVLGPARVEVLRFYLGSRVLSDVRGVVGLIHTFEVPVAHFATKRGVVLLVVDEVATQSSPHHLDRIVFESRRNLKLLWDCAVLEIERLVVVLRNALLSKQFVGPRGTLGARKGHV